MSREVDPEHDPDAAIDAADDDLRAAGLPTYTELAELLNDLASDSPGPRTTSLVADVLAILNREMKLDKP